jgi:hypothetical protein
MATCKRHKYIRCGNSIDDIDEDALPDGYYCRECGMKRGTIGFNSTTGEWIWRKKKRKIRKLS